ncbi:MAG TPA: O-antigen ligase family protein [Acidobacteriota bacterium]|nr:O-antigen ligase family protein [Acidobacteriota bacterium]
MRLRVSRYLRPVLLFLFAVFAFFSASSIAVAQSAFGLALICFVILAISERHNPFVGPLRWFYLLVGIYVAWLFLSAAFSDTPLQSMLNLREEWLFLIIPVGIYMFQDERRGDRLILVLMAGVTLASLNGIVQRFTGVDWILGRQLHTVGEDFRSCGFFSYPLTYGNYMATAALFCLGYALSSFGRSRGWRRAFLVTVALLALLATALANSRGPILALGVGLLVFGVVLHKARYALVTLLVAVMVWVAASPDIAAQFRERLRTDVQLENVGGRLFIWNNSLKIIRDHPVTGIGRGNFELEYARLLPDDISDDYKLTHAHCDVLDIAATAGIPGTAFYIALWCFTMVFLWRGIRSKRLSERYRGFCLAAFLASAAFFVTSLTEATFADEEVRQLLMFTWAAGLSGRYEGRAECDL